MQNIKKLNCIKQENQENFSEDFQDHAKILKTALSFMKNVLKPIAKSV